ncbi:MAG TPA: NAD-dependent succinate-semialdehyde dehydrogenase [Chthoniobacteraceae bacterium]|nr:NAD-dependent succinate-semialdehyde dehydrogenase [Chthoniobacteraceae bacterium]
MMEVPTPQKLPVFSTQQVESALERAIAAFPPWRATPFSERAARLHVVAGLLEVQSEELGRLMTQEMGKPLAASKSEVQKCASVCRYYADHGEALLAEETVEGPAARNAIRHDPLGVVLAVMPWNFPFWQVFRFAAPTLMAGNVGVLKHASNVPGCAVAIERLLREAGFPEGVFTTLLIGSDRVKGLIHDRRIAAVTLTGSVEAGRRVAAEAGAALKPSLLELGGSDPFLILPGADLERAAATAVKARTINSGQSCIAAKRFIIHEAVYDEVERRMVEGMRALKVGDPFEAATDIGPLATEAIADEVQQQVEASVAAGARLLTGGRRLAGSFYEPTVLAAIPKEACVYHEEVFGPVALLFKVRDLDEAIALANDSTFGLGAAAWSGDAAEQERLIAELAAGTVVINGMVASDPRLPFGGIKDSGYGRELGAHGIRAFVNVKTVGID